MQPKQTLLLAPSERLNWIGLQITLKRWREVRVQSVRQAAEAVALATVQPQPAAILVAADVVPHRSSPWSVPYAVPLLRARLWSWGNCVTR